MGIICSHKFETYKDIRFVRDNKTGYYLSNTRRNGKRVRLHRFVYETEKGKIPKGYHIHHIDHDKNNNTIENLTLMTQHEHLSLHGYEMSDEEKRKRKSNFDSIRHLASEWHKSNEGKEWHKEHSLQIARDMLRRQIKKVCKHCGKEFIDNGFNQREYCSNNCKSAYRRKSGVDNIIHICKGCGKEFLTNKYNPRKYCEKCKNRCQRKLGKS